MVLTIYNIVSNKYVEAKVNKTNRSNIKYYYEYKSVNLDKDLLMEYIYLIDEMNNNDKKKLFNFRDIHDNSFLIYKPINQKITSRFIYNSFENYFIESKYIDYKSVLIMTILNILVLSIHNKTFIPFTFTIYDLFQNLTISVRKYIEIILSITLRILLKDKNQNYNLYEKYFDLYQFSIEANGIFPNDEIIFLKKEIENFAKDAKRCNEIFDERYKKIEG